LNAQQIEWDHAATTFQNWVNDPIIGQDKYLTANQHHYTEMAHLYDYTPEFNEAKQWATSIDPSDE
jgi:hypothetical protein